jgi:hypothetical protein
MKTRNTYPQISTLFASSLVCALLGFVQLSGAQGFPKDWQTQPLMVHTLKGRIEATPFTVGSNVSAGFLRLPDGSVIRTVWPAALGVNLPELGGEPFWPRCEPAVYSLARVMPDGKELWAKSYIYYWKSNLKHEACDHPALSLKVRSALGELTRPNFYEVKYQNRIFAGDADDMSKRLLINPETGNLVDPSKAPTNLRIMDAYELRKLKLRIVDDVEKEMPQLRKADNKLNPDDIHTRELFKRLQKELFPKPPVTKY